MSLVGWLGGWGSLKAKAVAAGAFLLGVIAFFLRFKVVKHQRDKYREHADIYRNQVRQKQRIDEIDAEIELDYSELERQADEDIKRGEMPSNIRDINDW